MQSDQGYYTLPPVPLSSDPPRTRQVWELYKNGAIDAWDALILGGVAGAGDDSPSGGCRSGNVDDTKLRAQSIRRPSRDGW